MDTPRQKKSIVRRLIALLLVAFTINIAAFFIWVGLAPRSIPYLSSQVEKAFSVVNAEYRLVVGNTVVRWDGWNGGYGIHITNTKLVDRENHQIASFPDVELGFSVPSLLIGKVLFRSVQVQSPRFFIDMKSKDISGLPEGLEVSDMLLDIHRMQNEIASLLPPIREILGNLPIKNLYLKNATFHIDHGQNEVLWDVPSLKLKIRPQHKDIGLTLELVSDAFGDKLLIAGSGTLREAEDTTFAIKVNELVPGMIANILPRELWLKKVPLTFGGTIAVVLSDKEGIKKAEVKVRSHQKNDAKIEIAATLTNHPGYMGVLNAPEVNANVSIEQMPFNDLWKYWPEEVAVNPREWMVLHMKNGMALQAKAIIKMVPEDFFAGVLKKESIDAAITFSGIDVDYFEKLPPLLGIAGTAAANGLGMEITVTNGTMLDSKINTAFVELYNLGLGNEAIRIKGEMEGNANNLTDFMVLRGGGEEEGAFASIKSISGKAVTKFSFEFPLLKDLLVSDVKFEATSVMKDVALPNVSPGVNLSEGVLNVAVNPKRFDVKGNAKLNDAMLAIEYVEDASSEPLTQYAAKGKITAEQIQSFDLPVKDMMEGEADIDLRSDTRNNIENIKLSAILDNASLTLKDIGFNKPKGKKATLELDISRPENAAVLLNTISLAGEDDLNIQGSGAFEPKSKKLKKLALAPARFGRNHLELVDVKYDDKKGYSVKINGPALDVGSIVENYESDDAPRQDAFTFDANINTVHLLNSEQLSNLNVTLECSKNSCDKGLMSAYSMARKPLSLALTTQDTMREWKLTSSNAGLILRGLGVFKDVGEGTLETTATLDSANPETPITGKIIIKNLRAVKAPLLANMFSLLSLTGFIDLLNGKGIVFDKIDGEYTYHNNALVLKDIRAAGSAIGLTVDGEVNTKSSQMILRGNMIPAYSLNKFIGNVPLLGVILTGGEGQGVIAARYKISGSADDPQVEVNPFSVLTPGFLRNIWGIPGDTRLPSDKAEVQGPELPPKKN